MSIFKKFPNRFQCQQFFRILSKTEKIYFFISLFLFLASFLFLSFNFYFKNTETKPTDGGVYIEGVIGQPNFINPIYTSSSDVDRDLIELIFSGLMKYDKNGKLTNDIVQDYEIKENGLIYEISLKENLFWSDGVPLTSDDIIFTIKTIQNSDYKSSFRAMWLGIEMEKINERKIKFILKNSYASFLENLTQKIIPKHIWENIPPQNFFLTDYNLKLIGSGPYKLKELKQVKNGKTISIELVRNQKYFGKYPHISKIRFIFFDNEENLIKNAKKNKIDGFSINKQNFNSFPNFSSHSLFMPRYFAVFFNPNKIEFLNEKDIRQAINYGTNKQEILEKIKISGKTVDSPILPEFYEFNLPVKNYSYDPEKAKQILVKLGFVKDEATGIFKKIIKKEPSFIFKNDLEIGDKGEEVDKLQKCLIDLLFYPKEKTSGIFDKKTKEAVIKFQEKYADEILKPSNLKKGTGNVSKATRIKLNKMCFPKIETSIFLKFSLATVNQPFLVQTAEILKKQWKELGIDIEIKTFDISQLEQDIIKPRNYEALLFGEALTSIPDHYPFWHSIQKYDPGLNLAGYENKKIDALLEKARQTLNEDERQKLLEDFQNIVIEDAPAVFLYSSDYIYFISKKIKGLQVKNIIDPSKRFVEIENLYIKTKRVWKKDKN